MKVGDPRTTHLRPDNRAAPNSDSAEIPARQASAELVYPDGTHGAPDISQTVGAAIQSGRAAVDAFKATDSGTFYPHEQDRESKSFEAFTKAFEDSLANNADPLGKGFLFSIARDAPYVSAAQGTDAGAAANGASTSGAAGSEVDDIVSSADQAGSKAALDAQAATVNTSYPHPQDREDVSTNAYVKAFEASLAQNPDPMALAFLQKLAKDGADLTADLAARSAAADDEATKP